MITSIYEIADPAEAKKCIALGVSHVGSVLLNQNDWQQTNTKQVADVVHQSSSKHSIIPLFGDFDTICRVVDYYKPHVLHFCEGLTNTQGNPLNVEGLIAFQKNLKKKYPHVKLMRTLPVPCGQNYPAFPCLALLKLFEPVSDYFMIDTWVPAEVVAGFVGITGLCADWIRSAEMVKASSVPVILAGGLSGDNVAQAIREVKPAGVDSCTQTNQVGIDGKPIRFKKDFEKVKKFVEQSLT